MANDLSAFNAELWSKSIIMNLDRKNVMKQFCDTAFEGDLSGVGSVVKVRTLGNVVMGDYVRRTPISYQSLVPTVETMTVDNQKYAAIEVDDVEAIQNDFNVLQLYTGRVAKELAETVDNQCFSIYSSAHADNQGSDVTLTATTSGTSVYDNLVDAGRRLSVKNAELADRWAIIDPATHALLLKDTSNFNRATVAGDQVSRSGMLSGTNPGGGVGYVGDCAGFSLYMSTGAPTNVAGTYKYLLYGQGQPIHYVGKLLTVETLRLQDSFQTAIRTLLVHKAKVFSENSKRLGYIKAAV